MRTTRYGLSISVVRSEALFVSASQPSDHPSLGQIQEAIARAVGQFGSRGCAERVAQEFGDHPEIAVPRMQWARQSIAYAFGASRPLAARPRLFLHPRMVYAGYGIGPAEIPGINTPVLVRG